MARFSPSFSVHPKSIHPYLCGAWKRNLEWRNFRGAYQHIQATNTIVVVEEVFDSDSESKYLNWSFTLKQSVHAESLVFGYKMKLIPDQNGTYMEWNHQGCRCHGSFLPSSSLIALNFLMSNATISVSYHILGPDNMAVCIVETSSTGQSTVQYGNMVRIRRENYKEHPFLNNFDGHPADSVHES